MNLAHAIKAAVRIACVSTALWLGGCSGNMPHRAAAQGSAAGKQYNILFILVDDLGAMDFGYTGSSLYLTPNIDALASQSVVFTNAYASSPVCSPTRGALLTGKSPARLGITTWIPGGEYQDMPAAKQARNLGGSRSR